MMATPKTNYEASSVEVSQWSTCANRHRILAPPSCSARKQTPMAPTKADGQEPASAFRAKNQERGSKVTQLKTFFLLVLSLFVLPLF